MHVLLLYANPPSLTFGLMPAPYGLETLRAHLRDLPVECDIVNPWLTVEPQLSLARAIRPDTFLVGVSLRNLDDALVRWSATSGNEIQTVSCIDAVRELVSWCRHCAPGVPVILGGAAFAHMSQPLLDYLGADAGFSGMPEAEFRSLVSMLVTQGQSFEQALQGLRQTVLRSGLVRRSARGNVPPTFRRVAVVDRESVYFRFRSEAAVRTFTGCPLRCSHCVEHLSGRKVDRSEIHLVADEVEGVVAKYSEVNRVFLADSEVNLAGERRTKELVVAVRERLAERSVRLAGYFNPRPLSFSLLTTLASAGCDVRLTVDHLADAVLVRNGKNFRQCHIRTLVEYHQALGLELSFCLLLGQPGETEKTLEDVFRFVESIPESIRGPIYFSSGVRIYPGTPLEQEVRSGRLDAGRVVSAAGSDATFVKPAVYSEPWNPAALFDYVLRRAGGLMTPMNGYLSNVSPKEAQSLDEEFRAYHVGLATLDVAEQQSLSALSRVRRDPPFLNPRARTEFLWTRGRLALQCNEPALALADWRHLQDALVAQGAVGAGLRKLEHNIAVAEQVLDAS